MKIRRFARTLGLVLFGLCPSGASADVILGNLTVIGDHAVTDAGSITQASGTHLDISGTATFTAGLDILLANPANDFNVVNAATANGDISISDADDLAVSANAGTGNLTIVSAGAMSLMGLTGYNLTAHSAVSLLNQGAINPFGAATFGGHFTQGATGSMHASLGGPLPGTFTSYTFLGDLTLGGVLDVSFAGGFVPDPGDVFDILDWNGGLTGSFQSVILPAGALWDTSRLATTGEIEYLGETSQPVPEPSSMFLLTSGLAFLTGLRRRRRERAPGPDRQG